MSNGYGYDPMGGAAWTPGGGGYSLGGFSGQLQNLETPPGAGQAPASSSIPAPTAAQVGSIIQTALAGVLQVVSAVHGQVTGINPATGQAYTQSGTVPISQLGQTTITGPGGSMSVGSSSMFGGTQGILLLGGFALLLVLVMGQRK
jgi:hypothetical protein